MRTVSGHLDLGLAMRPISFIGRRVGGSANFYGMGNIAHRVKLKPTKAVQRNRRRIRNLVAFAQETHMGYIMLIAGRR